MQLSSPLFFVLSTVVSTGLIAAEPCLPEGNDNANGGYGKYDTPACDFCAHSGKGHGVCCVAIFRHSLGRHDDDFFNDERSLVESCSDVNDSCGGGIGWCYPGLVCDGPGSTCKLPTDNPNAHAASSLVTLRSSSTGHTLDPFVVVVVGLLGTAMMMLYHSRHRGFLRRHQYNALDATATRMDV